jgi:hypothetical protein
MRSLFASFWIIASILSFLSCTDTPKKTVGLEDISHTSDKFNDIDNEKEVLNINDEKPKTAYFLSAFDSLYKKASWYKLDSLLFPDRFGPSKMEKWYLLNEKDSIVALHYEFKDSLRTKNAFFNWIDCYGSNCASYQVGSQFKKQTRNSVFLVGATNLVYIESKFPISSEKLVKIFNEKEKDQNWIYLVEIPGKKKTRWSVINKGELKELKGQQDRQTAGL